MADIPKVDDDLTPTTTAGYKPPAQKTVEELKQLDQNDESLNKWKESLLKNAEAAKAAGGDSRKVVVLSLAMEVQGRPDVILDLSTPGIVLPLPPYPCPPSHSHVISIG